jgi:opacity protein-like surface antigen
LITFENGTILDNLFLLTLNTIIMKKLVFLLLALFICTSGFSQFKFKGVGGGLALGSQAAINKSGNSVMGFGLYVNALAQLAEKIDAEASFVYYFPSEPVSGLKFTLTTLNFNGHYNFLQKDKLTAYGLAGLNISMVKAKFNMAGFGSTSSSDSKVGFNLGAGGAYGISSKLDAVGQIGYTFGDADQLFINLGVIYKF